MEDEIHEGRTASGQAGLGVYVHGQPGIAVAGELLGSGKVEAHREFLGQEAM